MGKTKMALNRFFDALTRRKIIDMNVIKESCLPRTLTIGNLIMIGVCATLGISIYILLGETAGKQAGPGIIISLIVDATAAMMSGICYAELAARMPIAGSAYVYSSAIMGEALGFFVAWNLLFEYVIGTALFARGFTAYLDTILKGKFSAAVSVITMEINFWGFHSSLDVTAASICILLTLIVAFGWKPTNFLLLVTEAGNFFVIILIIIIGAFFADVRNWTPFLPFGVLGVIKGASTCFYAFVGYDVIAMSAEEAINPRVSVPLAIIGSLCISFVAFLGVAIIMTLLVPYTMLTGNASLLIAYQKHGLYFVGYIIFIGMIFGTVGGLTATLIPLPRLVYALAQDGLIFSVFKRVNSKIGTPVVATVATGILTAFISLFLDLTTLYKMMSLGTLMAYSSVSLCVILVRYRVKNICLPLDEDLDTKADDIETDEEKAYLSEDPLEDGCSSSKGSPEKETYRLKAYKRSGNKEINSETDENNGGDKEKERIGCENSDEKNGSKEDNDFKMTKYGSKNRDRSKNNNGNKESNDSEDVLPVADNRLRTFTIGQSSDAPSAIESTASASSLQKLRDIFRNNMRPTEKSELVVNLSCFCLVVQLVAICSLIVYQSESILRFEVESIVGFSVLVFSTIFNILLISLQPENKDPLFFRVPLVPWLPALSLFLNIYLVLLLDKASWIRFAVWLFLGIILYFSYGIRNSKAGDASRPAEYVRLH